MGANVHGCMDEAALNFNPHATVSAQCCYPPNRYVKVDMTESVFRENFWTMEVGGSIAGVGLPLVGNDEVCVPQDTCVKVTTYDESCDGMMVGGGGVSVTSRVVQDGKVFTTHDMDGAFECSKRTQFGTCPIEGCTDKLAINFNPRPPSTTRRASTSRATRASAPSSSTSSTTSTPRRSRGSSRTSRACRSSTRPSSTTCTRARRPCTTTASRRRSACTT